MHTDRGKRAYKLAINETNYSGKIFSFNERSLMQRTFSCHVAHSTLGVTNMITYSPARFLSFSQCNTPVILFLIYFKRTFAPAEMAYLFVALPLVTSFYFVLQLDFHLVEPSMSAHKFARQFLLSLSFCLSCGSSIFLVFSADFASRSATHSRI